MSSWQEVVAVLKGVRDQGFRRTHEHRYICTHVFGRYRYPDSCNVDCEYVCVCASTCCVSVRVWGRRNDKHTGHARRVCERISRHACAISIIESGCREPVCKATEKPADSPSIGGRAWSIRSADNVSWMRDRG